MLDGANRLPDLVAKVKAEGMNAVAITDHGNLCGAFEFYGLCKEAGIKPIVGYEAYIAPGNRRDRGATKMKEASFHLTLLAMNKTGYFNLVKLASMAYLEGFYYRPRIDKEILKAHSEGLICLSGCAASELSQYLLGERMDEAKKLIEWYIATFGDRFYMEIQNAGLDIQKQCMDPTVDLAKQYGLPLVATNDAHYLNKEDAAAHDVLLCVSTRSTVNDEKRMRMDCDQFFVRTPEEMYAAFPGFEEAVKQSQLIADRVDIELEKNPKHYPRFTAPDNLTDTQYLRKLCEERLPVRYGDNVTDAIRARLDLELATIEKMGYSSYFLIVWDFVRFAEENDIPCGARGSACGAIVAYLLGLSHVCPLEYDLLFERFLDASRTEPPDIDIDFCRDGRQKVIDYTKAKYGSENVCQIGTFGTLKAKLAIRDVGRALGIPLARVDQIAKAVPDELNIKLKDAIEQSPDLKEAYASDPEIKKLLDIAQRLEGLTRNVGTHAAGVVVSDAPIDNYIPLQTVNGKEDVITQWDGPHVEKAGLLKMDFLGLRNLTILHKAVQNVRKHRGENIVTSKLPLDDQKTFELLQRGETKGVFQFESGGIRDLLTKMKPDKFADIIATSALYRPGPLEGGMVMDYVDVKHGRKPPAKVHPLVDAVLEETYGVMVYQEQVMRILNRVGGIELADAYKCIKAISKKKEKTIASYYDEYVKGAVQRGVEQKVAIDLFELIKKFAGYGFNKSHSTAYGAVSYQTAYLKAHYPAEFMAALLTCGMEDTERISEHTDDARRMGIKIVPPDINTSDTEFAVVDDQRVSFGMAAIKGVGEAAVKAIVAERTANGPFKDIFDVAERLDPKVLQKATLEILIKAGALDSLGPNRAQHLAAVERAVAGAAARQKDKQRGQKSLFGGDDEPTPNEPASQAGGNLPEAPDWTHSQKLSAEKEVLGFFLTSHPLTQFADKLSKHTTHDNKQLGDLEDGTEVLVAGMIGSIKKAQTKKPSRNGHSKYVNFDLEDPTGIVRCIMWPEDYARLGDKVQPEAVVFLKGKVDRRSREPNLIVNQLLTIEEADKNFTTQIAINFKRGLHGEREMTRTKQILENHPGKSDVILIVDTPDPADPTQHFRFVLSTPNQLKVSCNADLQTSLNDLLGHEHIQLITPPKESRMRSTVVTSMGR
ncbi:MAG: DNA polymerase III subunit alpha [Planctomycetaceae bacterium]|nr:DNA polymerase III subunit alpha [Planctomycetaceae bacterium]